MKTRDNAKPNPIEATSAFSTRWILKEWLLVLSCECSEAEMKEIADGIDKVQKGKQVLYRTSNHCWLFGKLHNRPGFTDGQPVLTSKINRVECIDNALYAITNSGSCYLLENGIDGIGVQMNGTIVVEKVENGKTVRYEL